MIRRRLLLAIALGGAFAFAAVACSATSSSPPTSDSGTSVDATDTVDSASPAVDAADASSRPDADGSEGSDDAAGVCVGCASRLSVNGPLAPTCTTNGPPSSHQLLDNWGECLCVTSKCASTCAVCSNGQVAVTQACINCGQEACPSQYAACAADTIGFTDDAGD